jgi:hypothetical protein
MGRAVSITIVLAALAALPLGPVSFTRPAGAATSEPPTMTPPPPSPTDPGGTGTPTETPTAGPCGSHCDYRPCGPLCPDGSPMAICHPYLGFCGGACDEIGCPPSVCAQCACTGDRNGDGQVTIDEIIDAVNNALQGCPAAQTEGACFVGGSCRGGGLATTQSSCCFYAQHSGVFTGWCPRDQLDAAGDCRACADPCAGLPGSP